jgi:hypothetical protein
MSMFHTRPISNKENSLHSPSCLPTFISKPTLTGLGRSPKKKSSSVHGTKPYARTASVHSKPLKAGTKSKAGRKVPPPLDLSKTKPVQRVATGVVSIPLSLPKVNIPLVPHLDEFFDKDLVCPHPSSRYGQADEKPFEYIRAKLLPRLAGFGIASSQFRPCPNFSISTPGSASMAFGVPQIMEGRDPEDLLSMKLYGRLPDLCLAVSKKGDLALKAPASLVPVK